MPRRSRVSLDDVAGYDTLVAAFWRAARGHRHIADVQRFSASLEGQLVSLRDDILSGRSPEGRWRSFRVFDPKPRRILAPCFRDRVLHHALMAHMGPVLDRALVDDTFACRVGKGTLAAVLRAQSHLRRHPWFVKVDMRAYFANVDHARLRAILSRRFKDHGVLALCDRILATTPDGPGRGLPIGALTSQHFANTYLDALDRHLLEGQRVRSMVRYMDDVLWWSDDRESAKRTLAEVREFLMRARGLEVKADPRIGRSDDGVSFLGFRITRGALRLSLRRRRRYAEGRRASEALFEAGMIDAAALQSRFDAVLSTTAHADAAPWRRAELARRLPIDA